MASLDPRSNDGFGRGMREYMNFSAPVHHPSPHPGYGTSTTQCQLQLGIPALKQLNALLRQYLQSLPSDSPPSSAAASSSPSPAILKFMKQQPPPQQSQDAPSQPSSTRQPSPPPLPLDDTDKGGKGASRDSPSISFISYDACPLVQRFERELGRAPVSGLCCGLRGPNSSDGITVVSCGHSLHTLNFEGTKRRPRDSPFTPMAVTDSAVSFTALDFIIMPDAEVGWVVGIGSFKRDYAVAAYFANRTLVERGTGKGQVTESLKPHRYPLTAIASLGSLPDVSDTAYRASLSFAVGYRNTLILYCMNKRDLREQQIDFPAIDEDNTITSIAASSTSPHVAAGSHSGDIFVWCLRDRPKADVKLSYHTRAVTGISFKGQGQLVSVSADSACIVWDLAMPKRPTATYIPCKNVPITCLSLSSSSLAMAAVGTPVGAFVINLTRGGIIKVKQPDSTVGVSSLKWHKDMLLMGKTDGVLEVWELTR